MPSSHLILCRPLLFLPPIPPSIRVFSNESTLHMRWPRYWSFGFSIIPSKEHPGLISFRMDWLDLLAVQGTLKSLLQHHSSKASILQCSAFFTVQLSHPYMTTGKTIALTRRTFVGKVIASAYIPQLVALSSIFKANNMACLSNPASSMSLSLSLPPTSTFFLVVLCLHCCAGFFLVAASRGYSLVVVRGLLIVGRLLLLQSTGSRVCGLQQFWCMGSVVAVPGL